MTDHSAAGEASAATMHIGELAERVGLSLRSLRHWDEVGLVQASGRTEGGFRLYTAADERRVRLIMSMKPFGFTLEELAELATAIETSPTDPLAALPAERAAFFSTEMRTRRNKLEAQLQDADALLSRVSPTRHASQVEEPAASGRARHETGRLTPSGSASESDPPAPASGATAH